MKLASALYYDFGPFTKLKGVNSAHVVTNPEELDKDSILILHGGADISPSLYRHEVHRLTGATDVPSLRDMLEWDLLQQAIKLEIPIIGICRGAQMLCAAAGGYLIQHVDNHAGPDHEVVCADGSTVITNTCHHQMMYPFDVEHELLMWIEHKRSNRHLVGSGRSVTNALPCEPEMVFYPKIKGFAMQFHNEWLPHDHPANEKTLLYINQRL